MTHFISSNHPRPFHAGLLIAAALVAVVPQPLPAQQPEAAGEVRIALTGTDAQSLARVRRQAAIAADTLCGSGGVASIYGNGKRRCREQVLTDADRQIRAKAAPLLAARAGRKEKEGLFRWAAAPGRTGGRRPRLAIGCSWWTVVPMAGKLSLVSKRNTTGAGAERFLVFRGRN